jgi:carbamoyltransferase
VITRDYFVSSKTSLGIHIGHDRGAAVVSDGELVAQISEERLDRVKHSNSPELPVKAIEAVLQIANVHTKQLGTVGISYTNVVIGDVIEQLRSEVRDLLDLPSLSVEGFGHHDCHAWSSYFTSDFDRALVLVADGAGDTVGERIEAESIYVAEGNHLILLERRLQDVGLTRTTRRNSFNLAYMNPADRKKQISLGRKYEQFTYLVGFGHGHAGKTMALAAYAAPLFPPIIPAFRDLQFSLTFEDGLLGVDDAWKRSGEPWHRFIRDNSRGIAAGCQLLLEAYVLRVLQVFGSKSNTSLCAAGGLFLNCRLNQQILLNTSFQALHVIPAAGDDGQCVGAAFAAYAKEFGPPKRTSTVLPYLGPSYADSEIESRLSYFGLKFSVLSHDALAKHLAKEIAKGRVVGLLRGRSEMGPRALCHRSILADPRRADMKDALNILKGRELFRPFAPVVLAEAQTKYFDLERDSPFMLLAAMVRPEYRAKLPAITHVDGSSRVQSLTRERDSFVYDLLKAFEAETGFPILLNTSFNVDGDPIVESPHDATVTFLGSEIDILVLENYCIDKQLQAKK